MQVSMHDVYNKHGSINKDMSQWVTGYRQVKALLPNLHLLHQYLQTKTEISFKETASRGLYFSLLGNEPIKTATDVTSVQISYQARDINGDFLMTENQERSLMQVHISAEQLAAVLGETEEQVVQHFSLLMEKLGHGGCVIQLPMTKKTAEICQPIFSHKGHSISLAGHLYALIFTLIEQLQMLSHLSQCEECQGKLFQAQNLLEVPNNELLNTEKLAHQVGLNNEALAIGFFHLVGQSLDDYCLRSRIKFAAAKLRQDPEAKPHILAQSGFSEAQFEAAFIQHFGVNSHQYAQIH
ncbi:AraC family transcriptional regulator [Marinomonas transparens]|uniref:AraC family transcriptional regulator n=1 Tax=Marinomonas transparens TaxID=2795388 RepID=A0A934JMH1_9GAMM|nr:AraC family transcriptional regulator [Marinomonas transparens]MBJ7538516.1 AraC family transcriptional regulator [Marinomonas transparens]